MSGCPYVATVYYGPEPQTLGYGVVMGGETIDVYETRELAEAWVAGYYRNQRTRSQA